MNTRRMSPLVWLLAMAAGSLLPGCGGDGPPRYEISGSVTYQGRPVPGGRILFAPDTTQGNSGPGSVAEISEGQYCTRYAKGFTGGACVATIYGTDGTVATEEHDNTLFAPFTTKIDLPQEDHGHDFVVP